MDTIIQIDRMWSRIQTLAGFSDPLRPFTRRSFSAEYLQSRIWLQEQFQAAGLATRMDAGGNLIGRLEGRDPALPPIMVGSHSDTVLFGGRFDGIAGVVAGLEAAQVLAENQAALEHPLEVIDFLSEEPSEYGISCIGSQALVGNLTSQMLSRTAPDGSTLAQGIDHMGGDAARLIQPLRHPGSIAGFFELHIEQGPVLESAGQSIGIVTDIVGITRYHVTIWGQADHAGTTPMPARRDALVGAARLILVTHELASSQPFAPDFLVATIGKITVEPNNFNVVPGKVELILEIRSSSRQAAPNFLELLLARAKLDEAAGKLEITTNLVSDSPPIPCSQPVQDAIKQACEKNGLSYRFLPSGAGHDTRYMTWVCPAGMLFIPCRGGRSHCPEEWVDPEQLEKGAVTLLAAIQSYDVKDR